MDKRINNARGKEINQGMHNERDTGINKWIDNGSYNGRETGIHKSIDRYR